jgi:diketogulonate reductase-like aldo/keto reductase
MLLRLIALVIDTARYYGNEREVGIAVRESGIPRGDIFVTTKLMPKDHGYVYLTKKIEGRKS